jgi:uncharacterized protein YceK
MATVAAKLMPKPFDRLVVVVPFLFVLAANGCGTIVSLQEDADYDCRANLMYSGTIRSVENFGHTFLDVPFSFVADSLLLPYTIPKTIWNKFHPKMRDGRPVEVRECLEDGYK